RYDALGTGASEGTKNVLSKGLVRGKTDKFTVVSANSGPTPALTPGSLANDGRTGTVVTMRTQGATALKEEVAAAVSPALGALFD
uniref:hypothetical protein n=1 Tax=Acinetobacter baumannii TaxID=470 RepID=UPI0013D5B5BE